MPQKTYQLHQNHPENYPLKSSEKPMGKGLNENEQKTRENKAASGIEAKTAIVNNFF